MLLAEQINKWISYVWHPCGFIRMAIHGDLQISRQVWKYIPRKPTKTVRRPQTYITDTMHAARLWLTGDKFPCAEDRNWSRRNKRKTRELHRHFGSGEFWIIRATRRHESCVYYSNPPDGLLFLYSCTLRKLQNSTNTRHQNINSSIKYL